VNRQFLPRVIATLEPRVAAIVEGLVDGMLEKGTVDLAVDLAEPLPLIVIAELLGVPVERRADFKRWSDAMVAATGLVDDNEAASINATRRELAAFFREMAAQRREHASNGATDLISSLVRAHDADGLTEAELVEFCIVLLVAGNETTTNAIGNGALAMLSHPDQWRTLIKTPDLAPSFVEEVLRFDAPVQGFFRTTVAPAEVAGTAIPAGAKVLVLFGSANRDEHHYPQADTFLAARNPVDHIAFGSGIHACLGAPLARLEIAVLARTVLQRVGAMLPAGEVVRTRTPLFRGVTCLPVVLEAR
jgi:cytochrome P450